MRALMLILLLGAAALSACGFLVAFPFILVRMLYVSAYAIVWAGGR